MLTTEPDIFDALTRQVPRSERSTSGHSEFNSFVYTQSKGRPACVFCLVDVHDDVSFVGAVANALKRWHPQRVLFVGAATGVPGRVKLGDVLLPEQIIEGSISLTVRQEETVQLSSTIFRTSTTLLAKAKAVAAEKIWTMGLPSGSMYRLTPEVHFGPMTSWTDRLQHRESLRPVQKKFPGLLGIDRVCSQLSVALTDSSPSPEFLMILGVESFVGDRIDPERISDARTAAIAFTLALIMDNRHAETVDGGPQDAVPLTLSPGSPGAANPLPGISIGWTKNRDLQVSRDAETSCLRVDEYAKAISELFLKAHGEFCFGIFGHWGRGKTYLMKRVEATLHRASQKYRCVWFKAWKYPTTPNIWVHLYETLADAAEDGSWLDRRARTFRANIVRHGLSPLLLGLLGLALMVLPLSAYLHLGTPARILMEAIGIVGVLRIGKLLRGVQRTVAELSEKYLAEVRHSDRLGLQEVIGRDLTALLNGWIPMADERSPSVGSNQAWLRRVPRSIRACLVACVCLVAAAVALTFWPTSQEIWIEMVRISMPRWLIWVLLPSWLVFAILVAVWVSRCGRTVNRIALFVDDLDRCQPAQLLRVIESLKLLLEEPAISDRIQVAFLVEEEILARTILQKYREILPDDEEHAAYYSERRIVQENIEKLIIAHLRLPPLSAVELEEILDSFAHPRGTAPRADATATNKGEVSNPAPSASPSPNPTSTPLVPPVDPHPRPQQDASEKFVYGAEEIEALRRALEILRQKERTALLGPRALRGFLLRYQFARLLLNIRGSEPTPERLAVALANAWGNSPHGYTPNTGDTDLDAVTMETI